MLALLFNLSSNKLIIEYVLQKFSKLEKVTCPKANFGGPALLVITGTQLPHNQLLTEICSCKLCWTCSELWLFPVIQHSRTRHQSVFSSTHFCSKQPHQKCNFNALLYFPSISDHPKPPPNVQSATRLQWGILAQRWL